MHLPLQPSTRIANVLSFSRGSLVHTTSLRNVRLSGP